MQQDWSLQGRGHHCTTTGKAFEDGEYFYTLLFDEKTGYRREDLCESAYKERPADGPLPFSFWRSKYAPPPPPAPETLAKNTAEDLLRTYMAESSPQYTNARYLLAVMLERKRILKEVETKRADDGTLIRVYEHGKSGEVFVIPDPELKLDELASVQLEVAGMLSPQPAPTTPPVEPEPAAEAEPAVAPESPAESAAEPVAAEGESNASDVSDPETAQAPEPSESTEAAATEAEIEPTEAASDSAAEETPTAKDE